MPVKAPNASGLAAPKTPSAVRHSSYPLDAPRIKPLKVPTRDYGKQPKVPKGAPPPDLDSPFGGF